MRRHEALELLESDDLTAIGMEADAVRSRLHPDGIVTYCTEDDVPGHVLTFEPGGGWVSQIDAVEACEAIAVRAGAGLMAIDYLKLVALCRLCLEVPNIQIDWRTAGLKVAQLALRFGGNDLGWVGEMRNEPDTGMTEEEIRRVIRDAGFVPKKRLAHYGALAVL